MDFGIIQLIANIDRADLKKNHFMNLTQFGHNTLHHLFPSIDVGLLPQLSRVLLETCREFEVKTREQPWHSHMAGHLNLIQRTKPLGLHDMKL
jgi:fatty acid desaturase